MVFKDIQNIFVRLTAPYLFMLGVVEVTMKWFAHNAVFEPPANDHETCPQFWWRNLLYINTLFPVEQMVKQIQKIIYTDKLQGGL